MKFNDLLLSCQGKQTVSVLFDAKNITGNADALYCHLKNDVTNSEVVSIVACDGIINVRIDYEEED